MATTTAFLSLTLPTLGEFNNAWHNPVNQNFETIDDAIEDISLSLEGGTTPSSTFATLIGNFNNLTDRLAVSINADGTLDLSGSPELLNLATSLIDGVFSGASQRFEESDLERYDARNPIPGERFTPSAPGGTLAMEGLDEGRALLARDYNSPTYSPAPLVSEDGGVPSPQRPGTSHGYSLGPAALLAAFGNGKLQLNCADSDGQRALFNIDGHLFRVRESVILDLAQFTPSITPGDRVYIFAERTDYDNANYYYGLGASPSVFAAKDLRRLQEGTDGITSSSTFTSAGAQFSTAAADAESPVKANDLLVIDSGTAAGSYVIDSVDTDNQLTLKGTARANLTALTWHVEDRSIPNIGAEDPTASTDPPAQSAGRAILGECVYNGAGSAVTSIITYAQNGVYDTGWIAAQDIDDFDLAVTHNLGARPKHFDIWMRQTGALVQYEPMLRKEVVVTATAYPLTGDGDFTKEWMFFRSVHVRSDELVATLQLITGATHLFTDSGGTDRGGTGANDVDIRVIMRR